RVQDGCLRRRSGRNTSATWRCRRFKRPNLRQELHICHKSCEQPAYDVSRSKTELRAQQRIGTVIRDWWPQVVQYRCTEAERRFDNSSGRICLVKRYRKAENDAVVKRRITSPMSYSVYASDTF